MIEELPPLDTTYDDAPVLEMIRDAILARTGGSTALRLQLPLLIADALEFVIDPVRTARTVISELDNVE